MKFERTVAAAATLLIAAAAMALAYPMDEAPGLIRLFVAAVASTAALALFVGLIAASVCAIFDAAFIEEDDK